MSHSFVIQEIGITFLAKDLSPSILNSDFLKYSDIIPSDWEIERPPVYTKRVVQIVYKNGLSLIAQPNRIDFIEAIPIKNEVNPQLQLITTQFIQKLSKIDYQGVSINARCHLKFANSQECHQYLTTQLMSPGPWSNNPAGPVKAAIQLSYPQERGQLNLTINQAELKRSETESDAAIIFSGNFTFELDGETAESRRSDLQHLIEEWKNCINTFEQVVQLFVDRTTDLLIPLASTS